MKDGLSTSDFVRQSTPSCLTDTLQTIFLWKKSILRFSKDTYQKKFEVTTKTKSISSVYCSKHSNENRFPLISPNLPRHCTQK